MKIEITKGLDSVKRYKGGIDELDQPFKNSVKLNKTKQKYVRLQEYHPRQAEALSFLLACDYLGNQEILSEQERIIFVNRIAGCIRMSFPSKIDPLQQQNYCFTYNLILFPKPTSLALCSSLDLICLLMKKYFKILLHSILQRIDELISIIKDVTYELIGQESCLIEKMTPLQQHRVQR